MSNHIMHYVYLYYTSPFRSLKLRTLLCALNLIHLDLLLLKLLVGMLQKKLEKGTGFLLIQLWVFLVPTCEWLLGMYGIGNYNLVLVSGQGLRLPFVWGLKLSCCLFFYYDRPSVIPGPLIDEIIIPANESTGLPFMSPLSGLWHLFFYCLYLVCWVTLYKVFHRFSAKSWL